MSHSLVPKWNIGSQNPHDIYTAIDTGYWMCRMYPSLHMPDCIRIGLTKTAVKKWGTDGPELIVLVDKVLSKKEHNNNVSFYNPKWCDTRQDYNYKIIFKRNIYDQLIFNFNANRGPLGTDDFKVHQSAHGKIK
tara:strand:+ start:115 stop:516 length:402 start_codon:yes stop_codon:yes gene_type:complete